MGRKLILTMLSSAAILCASPALAQRGGGGGGPGGGGAAHGGGMGAAMGGRGMGNAGGLGLGLGASGGLGNMGGMNDVGVTNRDDARINSQGPVNASATGIAHANANSVLAGTTASTTVTRGPLSGVKDGMTVYSNGTAVGSVQQIRMAGNGSVALVLVKGTNGGLFPVPASKLSLSNGTLMTSARFTGINDSATLARANSQGPLHASATGIAHANQHSVLAGSSGTSSVAANSRGRMNSQGPLHASATGIAHASSHSVLYGASAGATSGVSVGMPVFSGGAQVGSVYRVVTANGSIARVLVQGTNGRIYSLSPRTLTAAGGTVTTSTTLRGL